MALGLVIAAACGAKETPHDAGAITDASLDAGALVDADDAQAAPIGTWVDLVREEKWMAAAAAIDALPDAERKKPPVRFARAAVALDRNDAKAALTALDGLDAALLPLGAEIARQRARAQSIVGPFAEAGEWLEKHATSVDDHLGAATAFMRAKLPTRANAECARVIGSDHKSHVQEAEARAIRLHTGESADAAADARWLLVHGDITEAKDAETVLAKEDPKHPLTQHELLARAQALADAAQLDEALHAIERAQSAPLGGASAASASILKHARADAMMRARARYGEAATLFKQCAEAAHNPDAASDLVWSARALSRADHDDEAIERYAEVVTRFPKSTAAAAAATFYSGRLELLHGRWEKAAARLDEYVTKYTAGADHDEAMHLRAIARFEQGDDVKRARALLEQRAGSEHDPGARARMANLAALAALKDGDRTHAIARFTDVVKSLPLSWPALVARARLAQLGAIVPTAMPPSAVEGFTALTVTLPEAVSTLDAIGLDGAAEEALRSREADVTAAAPARSVEALCIAYGKIDRGRRRMQLSSQASPSYLQSAPNVATRWAWECAYPAPYATAVRDAEIKETLPPGLLHAVMRQESAFDEGAVSPARAVGVLQLLPETGATVATEMGLHLEDARELHGPIRSITLGARYLHDLLVHTHGSIPLAVAAYNAGSDSVLRWVTRMHTMDIDAFVESIPFGETRNYVVHVMESFARYGYLDRGEDGVPKIDLALP
jgi:soluble lytic murein transglycosylase